MYRNNNKSEICNKRIIYLLMFFSSCTYPKAQVSNNCISDIDQWELGWRMVLSERMGDTELALSQLDSMLVYSHKLKMCFLKPAITLLSNKEYNQKVELLLRFVKDSSEMYTLCSSLDKSIRDKLFKSMNSDCSIKVSHPEVRQTFLVMAVKDQFVRGRELKELINYYGVNQKDIKLSEEEEVDQTNQKRLKEFISKYGFPTRSMIGSKGMEAVFLIIQHSIQDKKWQKEMLDYIKSSVQSGEMKKSNYAYLFDRIMILEGKKQRFGTQIKNVNKAERKVVFFEIENFDDVDERRCKYDLMPLTLYKDFILTR